MGSYTFFSSILSFFLLASLVSSSPFISDNIFENGGTTGRALLQAKKACDVDFENRNYTIVTSQCKGPRYPPENCCNALKQFACPFADQINDLTTACANVMFNYLNIYGKYPPGLFSSQCKEGKQGLNCSSVEITDGSNPSSSVHVADPHSMLLVSIVGFFGFIFLLKM